MVGERDWLDKLGRATNYHDLNAAFAQMAMAARGSEDGQTLALNMDEAIARIEEERGRDESELANRTNQYEGFKEQQSGVVGWFKRKLPFTETRRQELEHRGALEGQQAEICADNFVIARIQILKETILPEEKRRIGHRPQYWRELLLGLEDSIESLRSLGNVVRDLGGSIAAGMAFVDDVQGDIETFRRAKFSDKEEQQLQQSDLVAANTELKQLRDEIAEKQVLRASALKRLSALVLRDLVEKDPTFRERLDRIQRMDLVLAKFPEVSKLADSRWQVSKQLSDVKMKLESLPKESEATRENIRKLEVDLNHATRRMELAAADFSEPNRIYQTALQQSKQDAANLQASRPLYESYMAEKGAAEVVSDADIQGIPSPVVTQYQRLEKAAEESAHALSQATDRYERSKQHHEQAEAEVVAIRKKLDQQKSELQQSEENARKLAADERALQTQFDRVSPEYNRMVEDFERGLQLAESGDLMRPSVLALRALSGKPQSRATNDLLKEPSSQLKHDLKNLEGERNSLLSKNREAFQQRSILLLDQSVASDLEFLVER